MDNFLKKTNNDSGYTLIEMIVYVALIGIVIVLAHNMIFFIYENNKKINNLATINSSAYSAMERIRYELENSDYIYLPTSNMINYSYDSGKNDQLSLATKVGAPLNEEITFFDIYLENGTIFLKKEEADPTALTPSTITVSDLNFSYYKNGQRESINIDVTFEEKNSLTSSLAIHLTNTTALRSF